MPIPNDGEIRVSQINTELSRSSNTANSNFAGGTTPQTGSLFKLGEADNINQTAPHAMSEWRNYPPVWLKTFPGDTYIEGGVQKEWVDDAWNTPANLDFPVNTVGKVFENPRFGNYGAGNCNEPFALSARIFNAESLAEARFIVFRYGNQLGGSSLWKGPVTLKFKYYCPINIGYTVDMYYRNPADGAFNNIQTILDYNNTLGTGRPTDGIGTFEYTRPAISTTQSYDFIVFRVQNTSGFSTSKLLFGIYDLNAKELCDETPVPTVLSTPLYANFLTSSVAWQTVNVNLSYYNGCDVRLVWVYLSGSNFTGDFQLDNITVSNTGIGTYTFESSTHSFETSLTTEYDPSEPTFVESYNLLNWYSVQTATTQGRWNRRAGNTPTSNTGLDPSDNANGGGSYSIYAETSGDGTGYPEKTFLLRSPEISIPNNSNEKILSFDFAAFGATVGRFAVRVEVISNDSNIP